MYDGDPDFHFIVNTGILKPRKGLPAGHSIVIALTISTAGRVKAHRAVVEGAERLVDQPVQRVGQLRLELGGRLRGGRPLRVQDRQQRPGL